MSNQRRVLDVPLLGSSCYLENLIIGKVGVKNSTSVERTGNKVPVLSKCGRFSSMWVCEEDESHKVAKELDCNREWCPRCREPAHGRRIARWLPKAQKISDMGYLVVTFPQNKQPKTKAELSRIGRLITEALQRRGIKRGFRRWHFFGEDRGLDKQPYHPHLNFLFEARYMSKEKLASIKAVIREIIGSKNAVVNYRYSRSIGKIFFWIKYVLRPTFLKMEWDYDLADELYNFRNCVAWGKWNGEDKWRLPVEAKRWDFLVKIEQKTCPVCGGKLRWLGVCQTDELGGVEVCVHFPLKENGQTVKTLDLETGKTKRLSGQIVVLGGFEQAYMNIWMCGASPLMVQTFNLLKAWGNGFGGLSSCNSKALMRFFMALNEESPPVFPLIPLRVENNEDVPSGGSLGGKAPSSSVWV